MVTMNDVGHSDMTRESKKKTQLEEYIRKRALHGVTVWKSPVTHEAETPSLQWNLFLSQKTVVRSTYKHLSLD